ncbi:hypothetical protein B5G38_15160 [Gemmiger sp. An87]|nr:hypothetical protein B5G38_15160 [Gemmiger sp. An87]
MKSFVRRNENFRTKMQYIIFFILILSALIVVRGKFIELSLVFMISLTFAFDGGSADYNSYRNIYYNDAPLSFFSGDKSVEIGYQVLCRFFRDVIQINFETFWIIITVFSILLFYLLVKRYTKNAAVVLALFTVFPMLISAVQFRQWLSGVIVLYGIRYLESKKIKNTLKFVAVCFLAVSIHTSALFYLCFLLPIWIDVKKITKIAIAWVIVGGAFVRPMLQVVSRYNGRVSRLLITGNRTSLTTQVSMLILMMALCLAMKYINKKVSDSTAGKILTCFDQRCVWFVEFAFALSIVSLFLWPFFMVTMETFRLMRIILVVEYISLSIYLLLPSKNEMDKIVRRLIEAFVVIVAVFCLYLFCIQGHYLDTVFLPLLEENRAFTWL